MNYTKHKQKKREQRVLRFIQWYDTEEELEDLYYLAIRLGIEKKAEELQVRLVKETLSELTDSVADGTIALGKFSQEQIRQLEQFSGPLLFVDTHGSIYGHDSIVVDFEQAIELVIDHFIRENHTKIGILSGVEYPKNSQYQLEDARFRAFKIRMNQLKLYDEQFHLQGKFTIDGGYQAMSDFLAQAKEIPTAFFASSDALAIGAMRAVQKHGLRVPEDISIIGFNDVSVAKYVSPELSTIRVYTEWMGELAVETTMNLIEEAAPVSKRTVIATELILRHSTQLS